MRDNIFLPQLKNLNRDNISSWLQGVARFVFIVTFGLLPVFFLPWSFVALGFTKSFFVIIGVFLVTVFLCLSVLRRGEIKFSLPSALLLFWLFVLIMLASALLSGDRVDALYGNMFEIHTVGFFILLGVVMTVGLAFGEAKSAVARLFIVFGLTTSFLLVAQTLRIFLGPEFLSFGLFTTNISSYIGSFNDLALFAGLVVIVVLLLLQQLSANLFAKIALGAILVLSLFLLMVVNFTIIWIILGLFSLLMLLYGLSKDTWLRLSEEEQMPVSKFTLAMMGLVVAISFTFVAAGDYLGTNLGKLTGVSYLEVRPSLGATVDIINSVYKEDALLGVGANRFEDAWRQHKNPIINQTNFWNTNFSAGSGLVPSLFVTTGIAGGSIFVLFLLAFLYIGYKTLFVAKLDGGWYSIGVITFVGSVYLWLISIVYVPGSTIMLLAALFTGLALAVYSMTTLEKKININVTSNRRQGLVLLTAITLLIIATGTAAFNISKQYLAQVNYINAVRASTTTSDFGEIDLMLQRSQQMFGQDVFVAERARLRLIELNQLLAIPEPTTDDEERFGLILVEGINLSELAISLDSTNPVNYSLLASFYGLINQSEFEELKSRKETAFKKARSLDPLNPSYLVLQAELSARQGDFETARMHLTEAIQLKNNYTEALFLLSQLDIRENKTEDAIMITKSIINIEPLNPTRYFQLGVLLATTNNLYEAIKAFERAIALDNNYANARYFLALAYIDTERPAEALAQLKIIATTNPDNSELKTMISQIEAGEFEKSDLGLSVPVRDGGQVETKDDTTTSLELPATSLITPLNKGNTSNTENQIVTETEGEMIEN